MAGTPFEGIFRKIAIPFIALTAVGWFLVVVGFGIGSNELFPGINDRTQPLSYPYWMVCFSGPFVIVAAFLHAALWKPFSGIMGAICSFATVFFITALGMIAYIHAETIRSPDGFPILDYFSLEFAGALIALLFYTPVMILWHFYDGIGTSE